MTRKATPLKRRTLRDEVLEYLLDRIFKQEYQPGDRIVESRIAKELRISQGAVREAFRDFVAMGFLETKPFSSTRLRAFSVQELIDYYECRREIETVAIRWGIEKEHCSKYDFIFMDQCIKNLYLIQTEKDPITRSKTGLAFHETIVKGSGSLALVKSWRALGHYYWSLMGLYWNSLHSQTPLKEKDLNNADDHKIIYDAIHECDIEKTSQLMKDHFEKAICLLKNSD